MYEDSRLRLAPIRHLANYVRMLASAVDHPDGARLLREYADELVAQVEALEAEKHALPPTLADCHRAA
jgi:hypothetical protein